VFLTFHLPNESGWVEPVLRRVHPGAHFHRRRYGISQIRRLWNAAGFEVVQVDRYNFLPRNVARSLPTWLRHNTTFVWAFELVDSALTRVLGAFCTNFLVVARRRA
jgi:hypothetical protein